MDLKKTLNITPNAGCQTKCNKGARKEITDNDLCTGVPSVIDGLPIRCVGDWAVEKIFMLVQYFGIFSNGMKNKWAGKLNYIEICSGPGRCINRTSGDEFNGTSMAILEHPAFQNVSKALFFDIENEVVNTLNQRISAREITNARAYLGNYHDEFDICAKIRSEINPGCLNLVLIDPTDCSVPFRLVKSIKNQLANADFIINLVSGTDFNRNVRDCLLEPEKFSTAIGKYDQFLDHSGFFENPENMQLAMSKNQAGLRAKFRDNYQQNLQKLGYLHFHFTSIRNYYDILFATGHEKGIDFWNKAQAIRYDGQRKLF